MPRTGKGGARQGSPGQAPRPNRSDLAASVPVAVAPGQTYGQGVEERRAQQAVPVSQPPGPPTGAPVPTSGPPGGDLPQAAQTAQAQGQGPFPGEIPWLHPTQRPHEPVTAGMPTGPGPGPEVLQGIGQMAFQQQNEQGTLRDLLGSMAAQPGATTAIRDLAQTAGAR